MLLSIIKESSKFIIFSKLNIEYDEELDSIEYFNTIPLIRRVGIASSNIAKTTLLEIERSMQDGVRIQRERRDTLSRSRDISREEGRREIWENGNEVSTRRRRDEIQPVDNRGNSIRNNEQSERGSSSKSGSNIRAIRERETTHKSNEHNSLI